jgi:hypothetical protein
MDLKKLKNYEKYLRGLNCRLSIRSNRFGLDPQTECSICFETFEDTPDQEVIENTCHHQFHKNCLQRWVNSTTNLRPLCPLCNAPITVLTNTTRRASQRNLLSSFNNVANRPLRRSNAITPEQSNFFDLHGYLPASANEESAFDSP